MDGNLMAHTLMAHSQTTWKAGVASTVITPAEPMWLAGWASRTEPARGTLTELFAKALAIEDGEGSRLVLLTADLIAVSRELAMTVAGLVQQSWGLPRERLIICASHTHCGPEVRADKVPFFRIPPDYAKRIRPYTSWLTTRMVDLVGAAFSDMQPARLTVCQTAAPFARNRRSTNPSLGSEEKSTLGGDVTVDHDVPILEVVTTDGHGPTSGRRRAVVFGYACHNTTMPPSDVRYCGDYAGFAQSILEADDGAAVAMFIAGAGADQDPEPRGTIELARRHGRMLAEAVQRKLHSPKLGREITGRLRVAYEEVPLDFQPLPSQEILRANRDSADLPTRTKAGYLLDRLGYGEPFPATYPCPIQVASLGDSLLLIALGGEPVVDYSHLLKRRYSFSSPKPCSEGDESTTSGRIVWVAGYANDMFGYVPTARVLNEGGYEGNRSVLWSALPAPFAENTEKRLVAGIDRLVNRITPD